MRLTALHAAFGNPVAGVIGMSASTVAFYRGRVRTTDLPITWGQDQKPPDVSAPERCP
jgi:hypothetical protein